MSRQAPVVNREKESRSAAVRAALANPSKRQLSKWEREQRQKTIIIGVAIALLAIIVVVVAFGAVRELIFRPNEAAAYVHNEKIPLGAVVDRVKPQVAAIDNELARLAMGGQSGLPNTPGQSSQEALQRQMQMLSNQRFSAADQVLTDMIDDELVRLELQRRGLQVGPDEITSRINLDLARARPPAPGTAPEPVAAPAAGPTALPTAVPTLTASEFDDAYKDLLGRISFTDERYRAYTEAVLQKEKLRTALATEIPATQEHVNARRLTVSTQEEATAALAQIRQGERTLEDLAREKSIDLTSRTAGGDLGWLPRGLESTQFDEAAFLLRPGELSEPVVTPQGWEILQIGGQETRPVSADHQDRLATRKMEQWVRQAREDPGVKRELDRERREWILRQAGVLTRGGPTNPLGPRGF